MVVFAVTNSEIKEKVKKVKGMFAGTKSEQRETWSKQVKPLLAVTV